MTAGLFRACLIALVGTALAHPAGAAPRGPTRPRPGPRPGPPAGAAAGVRGIPRPAERGLRRRGHPPQRRAHRRHAREARGSRRASSTGRAGRRSSTASCRSGAPKTVVIYAHYDGQPVEPERWASPPWTPVLRDGPLGPSARTLDLGAERGPLDPEWRIFARSASDDKAPILAIAAALDALKAPGARPSVNLKLFFEGEEEAGSPHLARRAQGEPRAAARRRVAALRRAGAPEPAPAGRLRRARRDGRGAHRSTARRARSTAGTTATGRPNPALTLAHLVAGLRDRDGRIAIAGFYDDVRPVTPAERAALAAVPDVDAAMRQRARARRDGGRRRAARRAASCCRR